MTKPRPRHPACQDESEPLKMPAVSDGTPPTEESPELVLSSRVRLLEVDPDLGARLEGEELDLARRYAMLPAMVLDEGSWDIQELRTAQGIRGDVYGFVVAEGTITIDVEVAARRATRLA